MVRDHAGKKDMPLFLIFCVLFIAFIREPSTCDRKIHNLDAYVGCVFVCVCVAGQGTQVPVSELWAHVAADIAGFVYSQHVSNPKLACKASAKKLASLDNM